MAKVTGPLFSVTASGTVKKTLTYIQRLGGTIVKGDRLVNTGKYYFTKKDYTSDSIPQQKIRGVFALSVTKWNELTPAEKKTWNDQAIGRPLTGYNLYVRWFVDNFYTPIPFLKWLIYSIDFREHLKLVKHGYIKQALQGMLMEDEVLEI